MLCDPLTFAPLGDDGVAGDVAWPVLGGVPVLVPDPGRWLAARRDAVIGALVDHGWWTDDCGDTLAAWTRGVRAEPEGDARDFLGDEEGPIDVVDGPSADLVRAILASRTTLADAVAARVRGPNVVEVGCGAGTVTRRLRGPRIVVDTSLRALFSACADDPDTRPVVADAASLPLAEGTVDTLIAANVVDVVPDPSAFVAEAARVLRPDGRLVLTTPDPALGGADDGALFALLEAHGLRADEVVDGLPWVRSHGPRHHQVYAAVLVVAARSSGRARRSPTRGRPAEPAGVGSARTRAGT